MPEKLSSTAHAFRSSIGREPKRAHEGCCQRKTSRPPNPGAELSRHSETLNETRERKDLTFTVTRRPQRQRNQHISVTFGGFLMKELEEDAHRLIHALCRFEKCWDATHVCGPDMEE